MKHRKMICFGLSILFAFSVTGCAVEEADANTQAREETQTQVQETQYDAKEYYSEGLLDNGFFADFDVQSAVTMGDYKGITLTADEVTYTQEDVESKINTILSSYGEMDSTKGIEIEDEDTLNIDYVGTVDGKEFDGGSTNEEGMDVTIGTTSYIDGFLEQLVGHKTGEEFDITVTLPDPYNLDTSLSGKEAVFCVTINAVKRTPELTDEFVKKYYSNYSTVEEFREAVEKNYAESVKKNVVWDKLLATVEIAEYPTEYMDKIVELAVMQQEYYIYEYTGSDLTTYLNAIGSDEEAFRSQLGTSAEEKAKTYLVAQYICEREGIEPTMESLKAFYVGSTEEDIQKWIDYYGSGYIMQSVILDLAAGKVLEYATLEQ